MQNIASSQLHEHVIADIPALFSEMAEHHAGSPAVICGTLQWTYCQLDERSSAMAHRLIGLGARPEDMVAVCLERSFDTIALLLAILKAGAGYLPLETEAPADRLQHILDDTAAPLVVTRSALRDRLGDIESGRMGDSDHHGLIGQGPRSRFFPSLPGEYGVMGGWGCKEFDTRLNIHR